MSRFTTGVGRDLDFYGTGWSQVAPEGLQPLTRGLPGGGLPLTGRLPGGRPPLARGRVPVRGRPWEPPATFRQAKRGRRVFRSHLLPRPFLLLKPPPSPPLSTYYTEQHPKGTKFLGVPKHKGVQSLSWNCKRLRHSIRALFSLE